MQNTRDRNAALFGDRPMRRPPAPWEYRITACRRNVPFDTIIMQKVGGAM
jgi:hypothetical protein